VDREIGAIKRSVGRPSKAQPFRAFVVDLLLKQPGLRSLEVVRRARQAGYAGGKSALYSLIASVRPRRSRPLGDHDKVPGEIARHGFGQVDVRFRDGSEHTLTFFVSRLEYSRWTTASFVPDQSVESCVRTLIAHYRVMGGVPLLAAFDRARPIGVGADRDGRVSEWDPAFAYAALQIGLGIEVRARRGADRGPGTNLGNWLKLAFFKGLAFTDEADAARQRHAHAPAAAIREHAHGIDQLARWPGGDHDVAPFERRVVEHARDVRDDGLGLGHAPLAASLAGRERADLGIEHAVADLAKML